MCACVRLQLCSSEFSTQFADWAETKGMVIERLEEALLREGQPMRDVFRFLPFLDGVCVSLISDREDLIGGPRAGTA